MKIWRWLKKWNSSSEFNSRSCDTWIMWHMCHVTLAHVTFKIDHVIICKMHLLEFVVVQMLRNRRKYIIYNLCIKYNIKNLINFQTKKLEKSTLVMTWATWEFKNWNFMKPNYVLNMNSHGLKWLKIRIRNLDVKFEAWFLTALKKLVHTG